MINKTTINLSDLKLFAKLDKKQAYEILAQAQIVNFKKNKDLFFAEEKAQNFYLILEGSVKLFVIDEDGNETILQFLQAGDFVNEVFASSYQASARALKDSKVLVFAINQIRDLVKENSQLALNFLNEITQRNSDLVDSMIRLKLTDSKNKVGQFLLGMAFEKDSGKSKNIDLKYDKASLASYLGITPETLSRVLKKLKSDGEIKVEKNKITLVKQSSLCLYCDSKIASKCDLNHADFCTKTNFK